MARKGKTGLVLLVLMGLGLMASSGDASAGTRQPNQPIDLPEGDAKKRELAATVCKCANELVNAGGASAITPKALRFCVADRWWPITTWPPIASDPQSVKDGWAMVAAFVMAFIDDPDAFRNEFCVQSGGLTPTDYKIGDVVHTGDIDISSVCQPPIPQQVPIRVLFAGPSGLSVEAWDFDDVSWQTIASGGVTLYFPSIEDAVNATRDIVLAFATTFCAGLPDEPDDPTPPTQMVPKFPVDFQRVPVQPIDQYPWEAALIHEGENGQHWPTPGMFFLVRDDAAPTDPILALDSILGIARVALASAYSMAGDARQLAAIPAQQVLDYVALIACSPWNDKAYGATNTDVVGGTLGLGPHSRGINMLPRHADNIGKLAQGTPAARATTLSGAVDSSFTDSKNSWAQLWLPPIDLDMLRDFGVVSTAGLKWSNGDSVIVPPPVVWNHNVTATVSPAGGSWGC